MSFPVFASGDVLNASDMNAVGLWLVKSQTVGSGVSSVIVTSAFSADYDNYLVQIDGVTFNTANDSISLQLRVGSTTANTGYYFVLGYWTYGGAAGIAATNNGPSFNNLGRALAANDKQNCVFNVNAPFLTQKTTVGAFNVGTDLTGSASGYHNSATSYDQCVISTSGTMTGGTIKVYGYKP